MLIVLLLLSLLPCIWCKSFTWNANVDCPTGKAFSTEQSVLPEVRYDGKRLQQAFQAYPSWLCRPNVTFGLLRCRNHASGFDLRFLRQTALRFGPARTSSNSVTFPVSGGFLACEEAKNQGSLILEVRDGQVVTRLDGFRPRLCGSRVPIHPLRAQFYLKTQSVFHTYVMWRFHRYCGYKVVSN